MLKSIRIESYKSIVDLTLPLARVNVFIGENGAGKSNILEAIALAGAADAGKLDNEFLTSRGIRVTAPESMRPAFEDCSEIAPIRITVSDKQDRKIVYSLSNDNQAYSSWRSETTYPEGKYRFSSTELADFLGQLIKEYPQDELPDAINRIISLGKPRLEGNIPHFIFDAGPDFVNYIATFGLRSNTLSKEFACLRNFIIYSPENSSLRVFQREGQIEPLGVNGEGLLKLLSVMSKTDPEAVVSINEYLRVLGWFERFEIVRDTQGPQERMEILDAYLGEGRSYNDQRSTNEGFLFLTFYFALFSSSLTPSFFAVDNIDASLNPKLCTHLTEQLVKLAEKHDKQVLLTTHNPAVLDGLNLDSDDQRLFIVSRDDEGHTCVRAFRKPLILEGKPRIKLSEAFLRGSLGGLPKGF